MSRGRLECSGVSDADGWFHVERVFVEPVVIVARKDGLAGRAVAEPPGAGDMTTPVVVELQGCGAIRGIVVDGAGNAPISSASVFAVPSGARPRSLSQASRAAIAVEVEADELGRFELTGLQPDAEYRLQAAARGHLGNPRGVLAVASSVDSPIDGIPSATIELFPAYGALVQFVDESSGRVMPDSFSQAARLSLEDQPGELHPLDGVALDELGLPESIASGDQAEGLRAFIFRMPDANHPSQPLALLVESPDFLPTRASLTLSPLSSAMEVLTVSLRSKVGALHPVTLRILDVPGDLYGRLPSPCQVHLDLEGRGTRSIFVTLDAADEVHLMVPHGTHRVRFVVGGGSVVLPWRETDGWKSLEVTEPCVVDLRWPRDLPGVILDVRGDDGLPEFGVLALFWSKMGGNERAGSAGNSRVFQSAILSGAPYWLPGLTAGQYEFLLDQALDAPGHRIEVPDSGTVRVRIDRR